MTGTARQHVEFEFGGAHEDDENLPARPLWRSMLRGTSCRCPACGEGKLFASMLTVAPKCDACGEALHHHRADDLPAYLNIFVVGHIVVGALVAVMRYDIANMWAVMIGASAIAIVSAGLLMRPLKGMVVGAQWALRMHGFGKHED